MQTGRYGSVDLADDIARAADGTRLYLPDDPLPDPLAEKRPAGPARVEVTLESTLAAGRRLGPGTAALVFASARKPGGGCLTGARAQEEDIARASALSGCLAMVPEFYAYHRSDDDLRYSDRVIYSPDVPVFRDDDYGLLDHPYPLSMLTAAAPNLAAIRTNQAELADSVPATVRSRAVRVLRVAAAHRHRRLVLGAWGCGVFGNDPALVADAFADGLREVRSFDHVVFAIRDHTGEHTTYRAFAARFGD